MTARHVAAADAPAAFVALLDELPAVSFAAIDGGGGAGKTTLARAAAEARDDVRVLHLDDFTLSIHAFADAIDYERLERDALEPLRAGRPARFRRFDWSSHGLEEWREVEPGRVVIVEGVFALRPTLLPLYAATVWVETDERLRLDRGLDRDGPGSEALWLEWQENERRHRADVRPEATVDLIVLG